MPHHVLDNPAWNAMSSFNSHLALGNERVKFFPEAVGPFAGLKNYDERSFLELYELIAPQQIIAIPVCNRISIPKCWKVKDIYDVPQLIFNQNALPSISFPGIVPLSRKNVPQMIALTQLTQPGPFLQRTIEFGNYTGIFNSGKLVAMAGQRMHANQYVEISAVCTHPDHTGKGYGKSLMNHLVCKIVKEGNIPFLHVKAGNEHAINLYKHLGFTVRSAMYIYFLQKVD